jgi:hypothetical protein
MVIQVGGGRGLIIGTDDARYVVTAAHCLWGRRVGCRRRRGRASSLSD